MSGVMERYYDFCHCLHTLPSLSDADFEGGNVRPDTDDVTREFVCKKGNEIQAIMWECEW